MNVSRRVRIARLPVGLSIPDGHRDIIFLKASLKTLSADVRPLYHIFYHGFAMYLRSLTFGHASARCISQTDRTLLNRFLLKLVYRTVELSDEPGGRIPGFFRKNVKKYIFLQLWSDRSPPSEGVGRSERNWRRVLPETFLSEGFPIIWEDCVESV